MDDDGAHTGTATSHDRSPDGGDPAAPARRVSPFVAGGVVLAVIVVIAVIWAAARSEDEAAPSTTSPSATSPSASSESTTSQPVPSSTSPPDSTASPTTNPFPPDVGAGTVAWPSPDTSRRFGEAGALVVSFAREVLGIEDPRLGSTSGQSDAGGRITLRTRDSGPATVIDISRMGDGSWYVLGSDAEGLSVPSVTSGDAVSSPLAVQGTVDTPGAAQVRVRVLEATDPRPLGEATVAAASGDPFSVDVGFDIPAPGRPGLLVVEVLDDSSTLLAATTRSVELDA